MKPVARRDLDVIAQLLGLAEVLQLLERLMLDLTDSLAGEVEDAADFVERARMLVAEAVAQLEHPALAVREVFERLAQGVVGEGLDRSIVRRLRVLVGDQLAELGLLLVAAGLRQRTRRLRGTPNRVDLVRLDSGHLRDLIDGRLAAESADQLAFRPPDPV